MVAGAEVVTPYFWVFGDDIDGFERALHDDVDAQEVLTLDEEHSDEGFFRVTWYQDVPHILTTISNSKATIIDAVNTDAGVWELKILAPSRETLAQCRDHCVAAGISFDLQRVYQAENPPERAKYGLSDEQQEALEAATTAGFSRSRVT